MSLYFWAKNQTFTEMYWNSLMWSVAFYIVPNWVSCWEFPSPKVQIVEFQTVKHFPFKIWLHKFLLAFSIMRVFIRRIFVDILPFYLCKWSNFSPGGIFPIFISTNQSPLLWIPSTKYFHLPGKKDITFPGILNIKPENYGNAIGISVVHRKSVKLERWINELSQNDYAHLRPFPRDHRSENKNENKVILGPSYLM